MFAGLLPGLRDARTPMVVGLFLLATLWVLSYDHWPAADCDGAPLARVACFLETTGLPAIAAGASFFGYLIGMFFGWLHLDWPFVRDFLGPGSTLANPHFIEYYEGKKDALVAKAELLKQELDEARDETVGVDPDEWEEIDTLPGKGVERPLDEDIRLMALGLQAGHPQIFDSYDRLSSEAEFRRAVAIPLSLLVSSIAVSTFSFPSTPALLGIGLSLVLVVSLHRMAFQKRQLANDHILQALIGGYVKSPTLEAYQAHVERLQDEVSRLKRHDFPSVG